MNITSRIFLAALANEPELQRHLFMHMRTLATFQDVEREVISTLAASRLVGADDPMDIGEVNEISCDYSQETVKAWIEDVNTGEWYEAKFTIDAIGKGKAKRKGNREEHLTTDSAIDAASLAITPGIARAKSNVTAARAAVTLKLNVPTSKEERKA